MEPLEADEATPLSYWWALQSHGARLGVRTCDPSVLEGLEPRLPYGSRVEALGACAEAPPDLDAVFAVSYVPNGAARLTLDSKPVFTNRNLEILRERLVSELHFSVAANARDRLFVHAGAVAWRGRAVLIPGRSMSGKTSLVTALLRAGADYLSDEYAVVDRQGRVHPYPRPLGVRDAKGRSRPVAAESLAGRIETEPLPASLVVATRFEAGARFAPRETGATRGLLALIDNTVVVREHSRFALDCLTPIAERATTLEGPRGEADEAAAWILRHLDAAGTDRSGATAS